MKRITILAVILLIHISRCAASRSEAGFEAGIGNNVFFGRYYSAALVVRHSLPKYFSIDAGVQGVSLPKWTADVRPAVFHDFSFGRGILQAIFSYARQSGTGNMCAGASASLRMLRWWITMGYYHRTIIAIGYGQKITEPLNMLYEIGVSFLPRIPEWDLLLSISNGRMFEIERIYQPTLAAEAVWHPNPKISLKLGAGYKPAGMFNLSHNYYQSFMNLGISYKW